jgi:phosphatidylglycerophosphatase A
VSFATPTASPTGSNTGSDFADRLAWAIATLFGAGLSPVVPGTAGTLAAMPLAVGLAFLLPLWGFVAATLCVAGAGIWAADRTAARLRLKDPRIVVVDEAAGLMVTLIGVPIDVVSVIGAFFLFRAMDVLKPPPARQAERLPGGWGIMTDDLIAGLFANLLLRAALWALHALR